MIPIMLALLLAGIAAAIFVVQPAHDEYDRTRRAEEQIRRDLAREEDERSRLEMLAIGLERDERVIERVHRNQGAGRPGELRYVRGSDSRPTR